MTEVGTHCQQNLSSEERAATKVLKIGKAAMLVTQCHVLSTNHNRTDKFHRWCQGVKTSEKASRDPGCCILLKNVTVHAHENFLRTTQRPRKKKLLMHIRETVKALVLCMAIRNDVFACRYSAKSPS